MASTFYFYFLLFSSLILFPISTAQTSSRPKALLLPVTKDASTLQYITHVAQRTPRVPVKLTVDVGGEYIWVDCEHGYVSSTFKPLPCHSPKCRGRLEGNARACINDTICMEVPENPIARLSSTDMIAYDILSIQSTDGSNPRKVVSVPQFIFVCSSTLYLQQLAAGVKGMAGLGRSTLHSPPLQFSAAFGFQRKFALCLSPSTRSNGFVIFGDGPYVLHPNNVDVSKSLTYTPLILNPLKIVGGFKDEASSEYYIGLKSIKIDGKAVPLNTTLLSFNRVGYGGTKISTVDPYTVLETSIYKAVVGAFVKAIGSNVHRVAAVAPFGACFSSRNIGETPTGPAVPEIDLVLQSANVYWRIYGANSMVRVRDNVLCLGVVDGGSHEFMTSIVIGGHQIEDNLLQFDLASSSLGFSSSLLLRHTSCSNFNFTSIY
ncbi:basic 7S globulin-like [Morus notabilis]|uniref:basic 7S globulin-like n=1 Tax=Morus notabilis TaxID=981085 RepID=UPI000CED04F4|nr:basic 7S globulin-like [Morus notabilis]